MVFQKLLPVELGGETAAVICVYEMRHDLLVMCCLILSKVSDTINALTVF